MTAQLLGVALLIVFVAIVCFTRAGFELQAEAGESLERALRSVRQWWCGVWRGHTATLAIAPHLTIVCDSCGFVSPGVDTTAAAPRATLTVRWRR